MNKKILINRFIYDLIAFSISWIAICLAIVVNDSFDNSNILSAPEINTTIESSVDEADIYIESTEINQCFVDEGAACHV